jgi:nucleoside-diphosphate-sugar epimerase
MILVTGAAGFIGRALVARLLADPACPGLVLVDTQPPCGRPDARVRHVTGSIAHAAVLRDALRDPPSVVFHLASVPGGAAERDYALGRAVNLDATLTLLELLAGLPPARFVFASSIAVYGAPQLGRMHEDAPPAPLLTYGAHKLVGETLVADFSRRGAIDGRCVRVSGIVARPGAAAGAPGAISIFFSDLVRDLPRGLRVRVPMSPEATTWLMSSDRCVANLLHAARMPAQPRRVWTPPPMRMSIAELVAAVGRGCGADVSSLADYAPDPTVEAAFGRFPPIDCPASEAAGFVGDGSLDELVARAAPREPAHAL